MAYKRSKGLQLQTIISHCFSELNTLNFVIFGVQKLNSIAIRVLVHVCLYLQN